MTDNDVNVRYSAKADFSAVIKQALLAKAAMKAMNDEAARGDKATIGSSAATASARRNNTAAIGAETAAVSAGNKVAAQAAAASVAVARAKRSEAAAADVSTAAIGRSVRATNQARDATGKFARSLDSTGAATRRVGADLDHSSGRADNFATRLGNVVTKLLAVRNTESGVTSALSRIAGGFAKVSALAAPTQIVGAVAALLSAINPLVAGVGSLGAAAIGTASSLGTLAGAAVGLVPALSAALGVAAALKTAVSGVGGALTAGITAASASSSGSGTGTSSAAAYKADPYQLSATQKITRAQEAYRRSIQDVKFSEQGLFDARRAYTRQVQDLTEAVNQYADATKAADAASVESAQQNYDNVLASSASTKADKDAALAAIQQAKNQQQNDAQQNTRNQQDLGELKKGGMNGNQSVVDAQRGVQDAKNNVQDSRLAVRNAQYDKAHPAPTAQSTAAAAAAKDTDAFAAAMAKLSPAAQQFVTWFLKFRDAWLVVQKAVQQAFFSQFVGDLNDAYKLLPSVQSALVAIAGALGKVADNFLKMFTSTPWQKDITKFGTELAPILVDAGNGLMALFNAFRDLTMAALPFLGQVVHWLTLGAESFASFIENGRKTGTIQSYLDGVFKVMQQWWQVIKNVGATLYNYGKAAGPFATWLTDGLINITKGWKEASEQATKKGSPFQQFLENSKAPLHELSVLIGQFFGWFAKIASDPKNIKTFTNLLKILGTQVGPALGRVLDTLSRSGLIDLFAKAVVAILNAVDTLLKNGGIKGLKDLYKVIDDLANAADAFLKTGFGKWLGNNLVPPLVVLAGLSFAFGPLFGLFGWLVKLAGMKGVAGLLGGLAKGVRGVSAGRAVAGAGDAAGDAAKVAEAAKAAKATPLALRAGEGAGGLLRTVGGGLGALLLGILTKGKAGGILAGGMAGKAEGAAAAEGKSSGVIGGLLKSIFGGAREEEAGGGTAAEIAAEAKDPLSHLKDFKSSEGLGGKLFLAYSAYDALKMGGEAVSGSDTKSGNAEYVDEARENIRKGLDSRNKKTRDKYLNRGVSGALGGATKGVLGGAVLGAVDGGTIGGEIVPGAGLVPGALIGTVYGATTSAARDIGGAKGIGGFLDVLGNKKDLKGVAKEGTELQQTGNPLTAFFGRGVSSVAAGAKSGGVLGGLGALAFGNTPISMAANALGIKGGLNPLVAAGNVAGGIGKGVGGAAGDIGKTVGKIFEGAVKGFKTAGQAIGKVWTAVTKPFKDVAKDVGEWWQHNVVRPFVAVAGAISRLWNDYVAKPFKKIAGAVGDAWQDDVVTPFKKMAKNVGDWWQDSVVTPFKRMAKTIGDWWNNDVVKPFKKMAATIGDWWHDHVVVPFQKMAKTVGDWWNNNVVKPFQRMAKTIGDWWHNGVVKVFATVAGVAGEAWKSMVGVFKTVSGAVKTLWQTDVVTPFKAVSGAVKTAWTTMTGVFTTVAHGLTSLWSKYVVTPISSVTKGIGGFLKKITSISPADIITDIANGIDPTKGKSKGGGGGTGGSAGAASGGRWTSTIQQALKMAGAPASWAGDIATIIKYESGGNPTAINRTDSNAAAGHPSQGLMQEIPTTFAANAGSLAKRGITDPLANIYAGIRYIQHRYGSVGNVPGIVAINNNRPYVGYAAGGSVPGNGNSDSVDARLMPGEYILNKKAVKKAGITNLNNFNGGTMTLAQMLATMGMQTPGLKISAPSAMSGTHNAFGDINIYNPKQEKSGDSLARTVRKVAYLRKGK